MIKKTLGKMVSDFQKLFQFKVTHRKSVSKMLNLKIKENIDFVVLNTQTKYRIRIKKVERFGKIVTDFQKILH